MKTRINKYLASAGICSRREADRIITAGEVEINGRKAVLGDSVTENDNVIYNGQLVTPEAKKIYIAFNKPFGVITTTDKTAENTVMDYIDIPERVFPVGRLDVESSGLLLFTNDGDIVNKILKSENKLEKEYMVNVDNPITDQFIQRMSTGIMLGGRMTLPAHVEKISNKQFSITIIQGVYRQIRRMCEICRYNVTILNRLRVGPVTLEDLKRGKWRYLTEKEIAELKAL